MPSRITLIRRGLSALALVAMTLGPARGESEPPLPDGWNPLPGALDASSPLGAWRAPPDAASSTLWGADAPAGVRALVLDASGVLLAWTEAATPTGDPPAATVGRFRIREDGLFVHRWIGDRFAEARWAVAVDGATMTLTPPDGPPVSLTRGLVPAPEPWRPGEADDPWRFSAEDECRLAIGNRYPLLGVDGQRVGALDVDFDGALVAVIGGERLGGALRLEACERRVTVYRHRTRRDTTAGLGRYCDAGELPEDFTGVSIALRGVVGGGDGPAAGRLVFEATAIGKRFNTDIDADVSEGVAFASPADPAAPHVCASATGIAPAVPGAPCPRPMRIGPPEREIGSALAWIFAQPPPCPHLPELTYPDAPAQAPLLGAWMSDRRAAGALALGAVDTLPARQDPASQGGTYPGGIARPGVPLADSTSSLEHDPKVVGWRLGPAGLGYVLDAEGWGPGRFDASLGVTPRSWAPRSDGPDFMWAVTEDGDGAALHVALFDEDARGPRDGPGASPDGAGLDGVVVSRLWLDDGRLTLAAIADGARWLWHLQRADAPVLLTRLAPIEPLPLRPPSGPGQPPLVTRRQADAGHRWRLDRAATAAAKGHPSSLPPFAAVLDDPRSAGHPLEFTAHGGLFIVRAGPVRHVSMMTPPRREGERERLAVLTIVDNAPAWVELTIALDGRALGHGGARSRARVFLDETEVAVFEAAPEAVSLRRGY